MARKTKEEALETRSRILETAEQIFSEQGVAHTSLQDIAAAANVTRGAIYWHFKNKADLLEAMLIRIKLPMEEARQRSGDMSVTTPLEQLRESAVLAFRLISNEVRTRRVCEILSFKCEYVAEMADLRRRHLENRNTCLSHYEAGFRNAISRRLLPDTVDPRQTAVVLHAMTYGMILDWLLSQEEFDIETVGASMIDGFFAGLRVPQTGKPALSQQ
jgi:TetR/AcrR family acrAB operon transcriptional repressor